MVQAAKPTAKEAVQMIGQQMNKDMSGIIKTLEDNFIESVDELMEMSDEQCALLKIPFGIINKIKKEAAKHASNPGAIQTA